MSKSTDEADGPWNDSPLTDPTFRERLRDLPPSTKLVAQILADDAPLAQVEIAERALLPERTARYALGRLEDVGLVDGRPGFRDARQQVYVLTPVADSPTPDDGR